MYILIICTIVQGFSHIYKKIYINQIENLIEISRQPNLTVNPDHQLTKYIVLYSSILLLCIIYSNIYILNIYTKDLVKSLKS